MKQVGYRDKTPMVDKLAGQLEDAQERITDLEHKLAATRKVLGQGLAECEREKAEVKRANEELEPVWCKSKDVVADLKRKLAECEQRLDEWRDYFGCDSPHDTYVQDGRHREPIIAKEQARANRAENKLDECEREKGRLQDIIVKGRKAIEDAHDLLAETPRPDDRMSASTRDNHMIAWECICEALAALTEVGTRQCKWTYSEGEEYYDTECGKAFQLSNEHSLASNGFRFCCYCGAALTEMEEER